MTDALPRASRWLMHLLRDLKRRNLLPAGDIKLSHSHAADGLNKASARSFCHVVLGKTKIFCAEAIEHIPDEFIVGLLLHELAHMLVEEEGDPELNVDEFIMHNIPCAGYGYESFRYAYGVAVKSAKNVERVAQSYLNSIERNKSTKATKSNGVFSTR